MLAERFDAVVVVVAFFEPQLAKCWMQDYNSRFLTETDDAEKSFPFDFILDRSRQLYKLIGLKRSIAASFHRSSIVWYVEQIAAGRQPLVPLAKDDIYQTATDCIVCLENEDESETSTIKLVHRLKYVYRPENGSSAERPTVAEIVQALEKQS